MAYLRRQNRHLSGYKLSDACKGKTLNQEAQFWLVNGFVACRSRLNARYLVTADRGARSLSYQRHVAQYLSHIVFGLSTSYLSANTNSHRSSLMEAFRIIEDDRDDKLVDKALTYAEISLWAMYCSVEGELQ